MRDKSYQYLKFKRTYIGGSKKIENETFDTVQNTNGKCDWFEYRRILLPYLEDIIHIMFSRSILTEVLSNGLIGLAIIFGILQHSIFFNIALTLSIGFRLFFIYFTYKIEEAIISYNMSVNIIKNQIENEFGLSI